MCDATIQQAKRFGGSWTLEKLRILETYLDTYTTALKNQAFRLVYIDAFAGSGRIEIATRDPDAHELIKGSAERAVGVDGKRFDRLIFVDKNQESCQELELLRRRNPDRDIRIEQSDANSYIVSLDLDWRNWRGVIFLDPFATQVDWTTIHRIAEFRALEMWLLFPTSAIARLLPKSRQPDDVDPKWAGCLDRIYGGENWRRLYEPSKQQSLFGDQGLVRVPGVDGLLEVYRENLRRAFGPRYLEQTRTLLNSRGRPIFELLFCVGHPKGIGPAKSIAGHILDHI